MAACAPQREPCRHPTARRAQWERWDPAHLAPTLSTSATREAMDARGARADASTCCGVVHVPSGVGREPPRRRQRDELAPDSVSALQPDSCSAVPPPPIQEPAARSIHRSAALESRPERQEGSPALDEAGGCCVRPRGRPDLDSRPTIDAERGQPALQSFTSPRAARSAAEKASPKIDKIPFADLAQLHAPIRDELRSAALR